MPDYPPLLLLRLEGPMQSWGLRARWDIRDTHDEPTKSGLVGLLGCALGYPRRDSRLEDLDRQLTLGIRVEEPGRLATDFQTVTGIHRAADGGFCKVGGGTVKSPPQEPTTIVAPHDYLQDAAFLAVFAGPADLLEQCADALQSPHWPIYLGRRSCPPTRPVFEALSTEYANIEDALRRHPWTCTLRKTRSLEPTTKLRCTIEDPAGRNERPDALRVNPARMYDSRRVRAFHVEPVLQEEADTCT